MSRRKPPTMSPETEAVVDSWVPQALRSKDSDELDAVMLIARTAVAKTAPSSPTEAKRQLRALVPMLLDEYRVQGAVDLRKVLVPNKVEQHAISFLKDMGPGWCQDTRGLLGRIGRANNPQGWPRPPKRLGAKKVSDPYPGDDEILWRTIAKHKCEPGRTAEAWAAVASLGAGITGTRLSKLTPDDVVDMGEGRLGVRVEGLKSRLVPIRRDYTDLARLVLEAADSEPFMATEGRNAAHHAAKRLAPAGGEGLSYWRARSTWLAAHLRAETPLRALWRIAGGLSARTLQSLLDTLAEEIDDDTAARQGLDA